MTDEEFTEFTELRNMKGIKGVDTITIEEYAEDKK